METEVSKTCKSKDEIIAELKVANLESNHSHRKMSKEITLLKQQLAAANARISELEAACVMGGDGKPLR